MDTSDLLFFFMPFIMWSVAGFVLYIAIRSRDEERYLRMKHLINDPRYKHLVRRKELDIYDILLCGPIIWVRYLWKSIK